MKKIKLLRYCFFAIISFGLQCAQQVGPSGGPKDETPPKIASTTPPSGALNHPVRKSIIFQFSEWVDIRNVKKSISVFPTLDDGFAVTVKGRRVEIKPNKAFADSTTYHIGIITTLTDLHGVSAGIPYNYFFSTGAVIDSADVSGCVVDTDKKNIQPKVALYRCIPDTLADSSYIKLPSYLQQTDSAGLFHFTHLRPGRYVIVGFMDNDNDNRLTPGKDRAYAPCDKIFILEQHAGPFVLFPIQTDTVSAKVTSIKAIAPTVLAGEWIEGNNSDSAGYDCGWTVLSLDSAIAPPRVIQYIPVKESRSFALRLSDSLTPGSYSLVYTVIHRFIMPDTGYVTDTITQNPYHPDTIRFNGTLLADTSKPQFKGMQPTQNAQQVPLDSRIFLNWSKPVRPAHLEYMLADTAGDTVVLSADSGYSLTTVLTPRRKLFTDRAYSLKISATEFVDYTGNKPIAAQDTVRRDSTLKISNDTANLISLSFTSIAWKDLCFSLSGSDTCLKPDSFRTWQFTLLKPPLTVYTTDKNGGFQFDSIPGGKGMLGYFIDYNGDNAPTPGRLFPWLPPEPYYSFTDTIEARSRWDIEGVAVPLCEECPREKQQADVSKDSVSTAKSDSIQQK